MPSDFFKQPILNSPYECPTRHWELDDNGQPTHNLIEMRRRSEFLSPIPKPKKKTKKKGEKQEQISFDAGAGLSATGQQYEDISARLNEIRRRVNQWRQLPDPQSWKVTPATQELLQHWRNYQFQGIRPFYCQIEAVETAIWLTEVASRKNNKADRTLIEEINASSEEANPGLLRLALKLATGAGKTTVMAMLIAWQAINAKRTPNSTRFTSGFLIVAPGITIRDRLRVLLPNDPENYYTTRQLVPQGMLQEMLAANIVITNYHAFKLRERTDVARGTRAALEGWREEKLQTQESEGQMLQRVMPQLMNKKNILVLNDEAHHCYREKPPEPDDIAPTGDDRKEAQQNNEAARLWISGIEAVHRKLGVRQVFDLSATPFFLKGSGYPEGFIFPWTVSDFSLMDAIECGIVKLPRVPVSDNIPGGEMPQYRDLWENIRDDMPRGRAANADPLSLPTKLKTALDALYGHYEKVFDVWQKANLDSPPCFIIVCNNVTTSKMVYDYVSGFYMKNADGLESLRNGKFPLFRNYDEHDQRLPRPNTLLIDSQQLESGDALDPSFRKMAATEIEQVRRDMIARGEAQSGDKIDDATLLREVMNTVGKKGKLGETIRCVVSVSMLTEGWDCNTVTHVLGVRAFGTQLLCEQVIGRALRRQSYRLNEKTGLFNVEYADVLGIPFKFNTEPAEPTIQPPRESVRVCAVSPERDALEIVFPRVQGYRVDLPQTDVEADFTPDSKLELTPHLVGATKTRSEGIIGDGVNLTLEHLEDARKSTIVFNLTQHLLETKFRDAGMAPEFSMFGKLKKVVRQWVDEHFECKGDAKPAQLLYREISDLACERIAAAITRTQLEQDQPVRAILDSYAPQGSTMWVGFNSSNPDRWQTSPQKSHINWVVLDSDWEAEFCRVAEDHPRVVSYAKNHALGFEVPYLMQGKPRKYLPDFLLRINDGDPDDLLNLVVEIKGYRGEDAKHKKEAMETYWLPGVNRLGEFGRWSFAEFSSVFEIEADFSKKVEASFDAFLQQAAPPRS